MKTALTLMLLIAAAISVNGGCAETAKIVAPVIAENAQRGLEEKLAEARRTLERAPDSADALVWVGRRTAYLGRYREAIALFSQGIAKFPKDARFLRHRGHRLITLRCFDDAVRDLTAAAKLTEGKSDEIEPDGLPNAKNIPTSTLKTNIYYHLGLAHYLRRDFKKALAAYRKCVEFSKNPDMLVAARHWEYMTLRKLNRKSAAEKAVASVADGLEVIENDDYYKLIRLYQGKITAAELERSIGGNADSLGNASLGYGLGNWYSYIGETEKGLAIFRLITAGDQWSSFGYIAAEVEIDNSRRQK